jgi:hypothetical protein
VRDTHGTGGEGRSQDSPSVVYCFPVRNRLGKQVLWHLPNVREKCEATYHQRSPACAELAEAVADFGAAVPLFIFCDLGIRVYSRPVFLGRKVENLHYKERCTFAFIFLDSTNARQPVFGTRESK